MYWTQVGEQAQIIRAYMDGSNLTILVQNGLVQPNGLTIDTSEQTLYWSDAVANMIQYVMLGPNGISTVYTLESQISSLLEPFAITVSNTSVFWSDWNTTSVYATHKIHGSNESMGSFFNVYNATDTTPRGLEVVSHSRQPSGQLTPTILPWKDTHAFFYF